MVVGDNESTATKNGGELMAILIAMAMQRFNVGCITRRSTSMASLETTGCRQRSSARILLPRRPPWSTNLLK